MQWSSDADQMLSKVGEDVLVTRFIGVGQSGASHLALETHVVQLRAQCAEARFDIAQTLPECKLRKGHSQILIPAREAAQAGVAIVTSYATTKLPIGQEGNQLREHRATLVHKPLSAVPKRVLGADRRSNRGKAKIALSN